MMYIYHHLGLGDHIICNGMVRNFQKKYDEVNVFVKKHNFDNVKHMFRDNDKIKLTPVVDDNEVKNFISKNNISNLIVAGHSKLRTIKHDVFDVGFYLSVGLPYSSRFDDFYFLRNLDKEKEVYNKLNPKNEQYIFIHNVDKNRIRKDLKIIENPSEFKLFDLLYLIENATEVHLMESSIKCMVNSFKFEKPKFFYHQYVRNYSNYNNTKGLNHFETIK